MTLRMTLEVTLLLLAMALVLAVIVIAALMDELTDSRNGYPQATAPVTAMPAAAKPTEGAEQ